MADTKISALTALLGSALAVDDAFPVVDTSVTTTKKITTQELLTGLLGSTGLNGATVTTSNPLLNFTQTWNDAGVTFTALKSNITSTASATASMLLDLQVASASVHKVLKSGVTLFADGSKTAPSMSFLNAPTYGWYWRAGVGIGLAGNAGKEIQQVDTNGSLYIAGSTFGMVGGGGGDLSVAGATCFLNAPSANVWYMVNANANQSFRYGTANAAYSQITALNEAHTLAAAATSDTTIQIPANSLVIGVTLRVTTTITGCATLDVGVAGATTRYGTGIALTANTTNVSPGITNPTIYASAVSLRFTAVGGGAAFTAGAIRVTLHLITLSAPTS